MIPLQLTIEGLYSYQQRQTIDFSALTAAGLFGIFGQVGSGKSSILEAISYCLYGEIERMNSKEKRTYNMLNLKSNRCFLEFIFLNHENKKYKVHREFKRNSKNFEDIKTPSVGFYVEENGQWLPLDISNASEILGLSYANFKRTIIIPQGQFKEFLELGAKDRTGMMKEIFQLQRFDLQDKTSMLLKAAQTQVHLLQGELAAYENTTKEALDALKEKLEVQQNHSLGVEKEYQVKRTILQNLMVIKEDADNLYRKKKDFEDLKKEKPSLDEKEKNLNYFELLSKRFSQPLDEQKRLKSEFHKKTEEQNTLKEKWNKTKEEIGIVSKQKDDLKNTYDELAARKKQEIDLEFIRKILLAETELKKIATRIENGQKTVNEVQDTEKKLTKNIENLEQEVKILKSKQPDATLLLAVEKWFSEQQNLKTNQKELERRISDLQSSIQKIQLEIKNEGFELEDFEKIYESKIEHIKIAKQKLNIEQQKLLVQQKLADYSRELHDGEACPLCGAEDHPHPAEMEDVSGKIMLIKEKEEILDHQEKQLQKNKKTVDQLVTKLEIDENQLQKENEALRSLLLKKEEHQKLFIWKEFNKENQEGFEHQKANAEQIRKEITLKETDLEEVRTSREKTRKQVQTFKDALLKIKNDELAKKTEKTQHLENLSVLSFENYKGVDPRFLVEKIEKLKAENLKIEKDFSDLQKKLEVLVPEEAHQKATYESLQSQITELGQALEKTEKKLSEALKEIHLQEIDEVKNILSQNLDVTIERKAIEAFKIQYLTLKNVVEELEEKMKKVNFSEENFETQKTAFTEIETQFKQAQEQLTKVKTEVARLSKDFNKKQTLLDHLAQASKRFENLKTLSNLFKGAGFVQYVSSIYFRQLCDHANVRFHQMTRNQLSLKLNENNDFEIVDYLNEGKSRSVKTLSGGQSFQASLSLALALAESVQSQAKAEKNFFFIDEGFGTQDSDSVNVVFETLTHLQKQNRIVGIISHVEELKEKIPISIQIKKDEERGSLIEW